MRLRICAVVIAALIAAAGGGGWQGGQAEPAPAPERTGKIIVKFRAGTTLGAIGRATAAAAASPRESTAPSQLVLLDPAPGQSVDDALAALRADAAVEVAEADVVVRASLTPNDSLYATYQTWSATQMSLPAAWDVTTGNSGVVIAVLDTGVDGAHPDLSGRVLTGRNFVATPDNSNAADDNFHGTFVAGVAAATGNNSSGMAGVCWSCQILPVKVLGADGSGSTYDVAAGIDWAVANGADVINMSLGAPTGLATLQTAVNNAWAAGRVLVAATGNSNGPVMYPAAYSNVIAVGATTSTGARASFSNFGPEIDVVAPGQDVLGSLCNCASYSTGYGTGSGTSFSTPNVAGVVALMIADGTTNNATIKSTLESTATDAGTAGFDNYYGHGRVNAAAALGSDDTTLPDITMTSPANGATISGTVSVAGTASDNVGVTKVELYVDGVWKGNDTTAPYSFNYNTTLVPDGVHRLTLKAWDAASNFRNADNYVTVANTPDSTPPNITMTSPADGATISGSVSVAGNATDNVGVTRVELYVDGVWKGNDTTAPYAFNYSTLLIPDGRHRLTLKAWDAAGNFRNADNYVVVSNTPDSTPPSVTLTNPADGATVSGTINVTATASDNIVVVKVELWVDGKWKAKDVSSPYAFSYNTALLPNGTHRFTAKAWDAAGNWTNADAWVTVSN
jgi:subtilisin family serine protease